MCRHYAVSSSPFVLFSAVFTSSQEGFDSQVEPEKALHCASLRLRPSKK